MKSDLQPDFAANILGGENEIAYATALHGADQWIQIFPAEKEWYGKDGRGPYKMSDPQKIIEASSQESFLNFARVDREHASLLAPDGTDVPAAGWFQEFAVRDGGAIWGRVEWNERAKQELANKEYRFFSPEFVIDKKTREITVITGGSLTNNPNFRQLQAVASAEKNTSSKKETNQMKEELIALAKAHGLDPETASEEEILTAATKSKKELTALQTDFASFREALDLDADAETSVIIETASAKAKSAPPDPEEFVPKKAYDELATRMDALEKDTANKEAEEAVAAAMKAGKVSPAMKDWATSLAQKNMDSFNEFVGNQPKIIDDKEIASGKKSGHGSSKHSAEEIEVARQLGVSLEDLDKSESEEAA